ncbi:MAG: hypothetical protein KAG97_05415 [Victivallales bacterium]|nr:hypothetical protein [Victivallales bacterium]
MIEREIDGWRFELESSGVLEPWFANFAESVESGLVKRNSERVVFKATSSDSELYVKHSRPVSFLQRSRSRLKPKLKSEFDSITLCESLGVPVVHCLGWGARAAESMLITECVPNAVDAKTHWFAEASTDPAAKKNFLAGFADFLNSFIDAAVEHPDFHPGNILVSFPEDGSKPIFTLVDLYGVKKSRSPRDDRAMDALPVIGGFRGEMTDAEGIAFVDAIFADGVLPDEQRKQRALDIWCGLLEVESVKAGALWRKREPKILSDSRYSRIVEIADGRRCRVRISLSGDPALSVSKIDDALAELAGSRFLVERMPREEASLRWRHTSLLEIFRLPHNRVSGWMENDSGDDEILVEKEVATVLSGAEIAERYSISGLEKDGISL